MKSRRKPTPYAPPAPPPPRLPEPGEPVWGTLRPMPDSWSWEAWNAHKMRIPNLAEQAYALPRFQRRWTWSLDRVLSYLQSILDGEAQTPIVMWRPYKAEHAILLDGQHRLVSLGATVTDDTGAVRPLPAVRLNLVSMLWEPGEPDNRESVGVDLVFARDPLRILRDRDRTGRQYQSDAFTDCVCSVIQRIQHDLDLPVISSREPESAEAWRRTADYFLRLNRSVPFTDAELSGLLADAHKETP